MDFQHSNPSKPQFGHFVDSFKFSLTPIIALTAYAMLDNKGVIAKNGFNDIVTKPINSQILSTKLKSFLINSNIAKR